jgi:3-oxoacyl-[acyl-carrier-protein] synthase-3
MMLKKVMGYDKHRIFDEDVCISELCAYLLDQAFATGRLDRAELDAIIVVTQSPDYFMPGTACVVHGLAGLRRDTLCFDINQGCAGFLIGLMEAFMLLDKGLRKVALFNADILSRKVSKKDRNSYPLIGDAAALTIVEQGDVADDIPFSVYFDGTRSMALNIPAGGFKRASDAETATLQVDEEGNERALDHLRMDGTGVFNFVMTEVPPMIEHLLEIGGVGKDEIDAYLFHQPNRFMLQKLADMCGVKREKMFSNIVENFGNSSGVTVPLGIAFNLGDALKTEMRHVCLSGFGVGLTWAACLIKIGMMDFCEIIEYEKGN